LRADQERRRYPWWQLILLGLAGLGESIVWPIRRMWRSDNPIDTYALVHMGSTAGDAMVAIALADSIFFSIPVGEAQGQVARYLALTMAPLALAGPFLVPLLDRAGPRRAISFGSAAGRAILAVFLAARVESLLLFPIALAMLVLTKVHLITKNGLTLAYAGRSEGLVRTNARLGRIAVGGALLGAPPALLLVKLGGAPVAILGASVVYVLVALVNLRLPHPRVEGGPGEVTVLGAMPAIGSPAIGAAGLRAAAGFLLFLLAFALRRQGLPASWFGLLGAAGTLGSFLGDVVAPRLPSAWREELVVVGCVAIAGIGAFLAFQAFTLPVLILFGLVAGMATESGRLAFQSLAQQLVPAGAFGRVFVRYEVLFQVAWIAGALMPAVLDIDFRGGILVMAGWYMLVGLSFLLWPRWDRRRERQLLEETGE